MATSTRKAYIRTGRTWGSNSAVDARFVADVIANNACHAADSFGQVRVNYVRTNYTLADNPVLRYGVGGAYYNGWLHLGSFGKWPLPLRSDGTSYRYRIRIAGSSIGDGATTTYRVILSPPGLALGYRRSNIAEDFVFEASTNSATPVWMTNGQSQGSNAWSSMIEVPSSYASSWMVESTTRTTIGGDSAAVAHPIVSANVFAKSDHEDPDADWLLAVEGLYLTEWIGV